MKLFKLIVAPMTTIVLALATTAANAATYQSFLTLSDPSAHLGSGPYGIVTLTEGGSGTGAYVDVNVDLYNGSRFVQTSGFDGDKHNAFVWNLTNSPAGTVTIQAPVDTFTVDSTVPDENTPFGFFTNGILCCNKNGASAAEDPPLNFRVTDTNGITVLGVGGSWVGSTVTWGAGDRFATNTGGFLFSADIVTTSGFTGNVASSAIASPIPEPETYAMLLAGLGLLGLMGRRRKQRLAA